MKNISEKKLLIIIVVLLVIIAAPVAINAYAQGGNLISALFVYMKEEHCSKEFPAHTVKALSQKEFDAFIDKEINENSDSNKYYFFKFGEYKKLTLNESMRLFHRSLLEDANYSPGSYNANDNTCTYSSNGVGVRSDTIPWYYF